MTEITNPYLSEHTGEEIDESVRSTQALQRTIQAAIAPLATKAALTETNTALETEKTRARGVEKALNDKLEKVETNVSSTLETFSTEQQQKMDEFQTSIESQFEEQDNHIKQQITQQNENVENQLKENNDKVNDLAQEIFKIKDAEQKTKTGTLINAYITEQGRISSPGVDRFAIQYYAVEAGKTYHIKKFAFSLANNYPCVAYMSATPQVGIDVSEIIASASSSATDIDIIWEAKDNGYICCASAWENVVLDVFDTIMENEINVLQNDLNTIEKAIFAPVESNDILSDVIIEEAYIASDQVIRGIVGNPNFKVLGYAVKKGNTYIVKGDAFHLSSAYPCLGFMLQAPSKASAVNTILLNADNTPSKIYYTFVCEQDGYLVTATNGSSVLSIYGTIAKNRIDIIEDNLHKYKNTKEVEPATTLDDAYIAESSRISSVGAEWFKVFGYAVKKGKIYRAESESFALSGNYPCLCFMDQNPSIGAFVNNVFLLASSTPARVNYLYICDNDGYLLTATNGRSKITIYECESVDKLDDIDKVLAKHEEALSIIKSPLVDKSIGIIGDSIMLLMGNISYGGNTISYIGTDGNAYTMNQLTFIGSHLYVTSSLQNGQVVTTSIRCEQHNSKQNVIDSNNWEALKKALGVSELINCGLGGATLEERSLQTAYPYSDDANTTCISNGALMLKRLVDTGRKSPDCVMIWAGINNCGNRVVGDYDTIVNLDWGVLSDNVQGAEYRKTKLGGLRFTIEYIYRNLPDARIFLFTPAQCVPGWHPYEDIEFSANLIKKLASRYSCKCFDALSELNVISAFETKNANGRYLNDGLHPNPKGRELWANYAAKMLNVYYSQK